MVVPNNHLKNVPQSSDFFRFKQDPKELGLRNKNPLILLQLLVNIGYAKRST